MLELTLDNYLSRRKTIRTREIKNIQEKIKEMRGPMK
jgi:hypothetical protein